MFYAGLDLSRKRLDYLALSDLGELREGAVAPDADGLDSLPARLDAEPVIAVIESQNGARFVHDRLELRGWDVRIADARKVKGLAPLACKTDRVDARVLAELARIDLVPEIWLPDPEVRRERERSRFRLHLVRHRTQLKNRVHHALYAHGPALLRLRSLRSRGPRATRLASAPPALGLKRPDLPGADRRARP